MLALVASLLAGCASAPRPSHGGLAPAPPVELITSAWSFDGQPGHQIRSPHYLLYTTEGDAVVADHVAQVMEGALREYQHLAPAISPGDEPMKCYLFGSREQWSQFTRENTGADAGVYLHINRGGYTVGDWYVAYFIGDVGTYSVAAHEGFHQYASRYFKQRIPPFLEEGLACMFEDVRWDQSRPYWDLMFNGGRLSSLKTAVSAHAMFPLDELATTHAGQIVSGPRVRISAFYGESWAFARFLWGGEHGRYRPALQRMLSDAAKGQLRGAAPSAGGRSALWDPRSARPLLESYLQTDLQTLDKRFVAYVDKLIAGADQDEAEE